MTTTASYTYLSCAETAKLIRAALKQSFPGTKFSVRSDNYAGGASIRVGWVDGPFQDAVEKVAKKFEGAEFDGMIDLKSYKPNTTLPDGRVVHFGADFVFCDRAISSQLRAEATAVAEAAFSKDAHATKTYGAFQVDGPFNWYEAIMTPFGLWQGGNGYSLVRFIAARMTPGGGS